MLDPETGEQLRDAKGKPRTFAENVRERGIMRGRHGETLPFRLVDKNPERVVEYDWVPEEWKEVARRNIAEGR